MTSTQTCETIITTSYNILDVLLYNFKGKQLAVMNYLKWKKCQKKMNNWGFTNYMVWIILPIRVLTPCGLFSKLACNVLWNYIELSLLLYSNLGKPSNVKVDKIKNECSISVSEMIYFQKLSLFTFMASLALPWHFHSHISWTIFKILKWNIFTPQACPSW